MPLKIIEPRRPQVGWNHLGRQLKMWRSYHIVDAHALKLLRLWIGYEFLDLMDEFGRFPIYNLNEIRRRLGYKYTSLMIDDIRISKSFYIVGNSESDITAIFSPVWHFYDPQDGQLLSGSSCTEESQNESQNGGYSKNIYNKNNPTGGNATAITEGAIPAIDETENMKREAIVRRHMVRDYFTWMQRQTNPEHQSLIDDILFRIRNPRNRNGEVLKDQVLDDAQAREVFQIMIDSCLVPYFQTREEFFKPTYIQHPEKRVFWLTNLFKRYSGNFIIRARRQWQRTHKELEAQAQVIADQQQMQYRPRSPYEWEDPDGFRWYLSPTGVKLMIPADAEPRPSDSATFNYISRTWK